MKGLLMKDWIVMWKRNKIMFLILFLYITVAPFFDNYMFPGMAFAFVGLLSVSTVTLDEQCKWEQYAITMPYSRKDIVFSKFAFVLIALATLSLLYFLVWIISAVIQGNSFHLKEYFNLLMTYLSIGFLIPAINFPFVIKLGTQKGMLITVFFSVLGATVAMDPLMNFNVALPPALLSILALVLLGVSAFISLKIYERREL